MSTLRIIHPWKDLIQWEVRTHTCSDRSLRSISLLPHATAPHPHFLGCWSTTLGESNCYMGFQGTKTLLTIFCIFPSLYFSLSVFRSLYLAMHLISQIETRNHLYAFWFISKYYKRTLTCFYHSCSMEADIIIYKILYWIWHRSTRPKIFSFSKPTSVHPQPTFLFFWHFLRKQENGPVLG